MGTILASFQTFGKRPFEIERLSSFASDGAILGAVDFSMRPEMPSRPLALDTSRPAIMAATSSGVHK